MTTPGPHVFRDGRFGCWIITPSNGDVAGKIAERATALRELGITDLFVRGPDGTTTVKRLALERGFSSCCAYWSPDGLTAAAYAARALADVGRWSPGAGELNIEVGNDPALEPYVRAAVGAFRAQRASYRLRVNVAGRKGGFLPGDLFTADANLYACEQVYLDALGPMTMRLSEADALERLELAGIPREKCAICYAGAVEVGGSTAGKRVAGLPQWLPNRGVVFSDDLLAEAGLL